MLGEHHLELLETAAHGLGIPEPDDGHDDGGDDEEDEVVFPADGLDGDRGDHVDYEIPEPVAASQWGVFGESGGGKDGREVTHQ